MPLQFDAIYENGVLRPLQPLQLSEHECVVVSVVKAEAVPAHSHLDLEYVERLKMDLFDTESPTGLEDVRQRLSKTSGSMTAEIVAERGER